MSAIGENSREDNQAGIVICEVLYESLQPVFSAENFPKCFVEICPSNCSGQCISTGFMDAASRFPKKCSEIYFLTCSYQSNSYSPDSLHERLVDIREAAELFYPPDILLERKSSGDCFILPLKSQENKGYIKFLKDSGIFESSVSRIIVPDTGATEIKPDFIRALKEISGLPVKIEKVSVIYAENYLGSLLYKAINRYQAAETEKAYQEIGVLKKKMSDMMVAMNMFGLIVGLKEEENVIEATIELFSELCSPEQVVYAGVEDGIISSVFRLRPRHGTVPGIDLLQGTKQPDISYGFTDDGFILPVSVWGEVVGIISIEGMDRNNITEDQLNTSRLFLPLCGLIIKNTRNYNALEAAVKVRDEEIELRKTAEESLSAAIRKLNLLSGITRHDILNQIVVANYYLEIAMEDNPEYRAMVNPVKKSVDQIHRQIEFTRNYQDLGILPPSWQNCPNLIRTCFKERDYPTEIIVEIDLPETDLFADAMLGKAFCNIISNAYNHAEGMQRLEISGIPEEDGSFLITIADDGEGVPEDKKIKIFKPGHGKNHGYGLFLVKEILGLTDIEIRETGIYGEGAVFEIRIPSGSWRNADAV